MGVPVIFPIELAGKDFRTNNEVEMVKAEGGGKGEAFSKDRGFGGEERMAGDIDDRGNPGGVGCQEGREWGRWYRGGECGWVKWVRSGGRNLRGRRGECGQGWGD